MARGGNMQITATAQEASDEELVLFEEGGNYAKRRRTWDVVYKALPVDKVVRFDCADENDAKRTLAGLRKAATKVSEDVTAVIAQEPWRVLARRNNPFPEPAHRDPVRGGVK